MISMNLKTTSKKDEFISERTANSCESFHSKFKEMFSSPHLNIFIFVQVLLELQEEVYILLQSDIKISSRSMLNNNYKKHIAFLKRTLNKYRSGAITRFDYIQKVCKKYN